MKRMLSINNEPLTVLNRLYELIQKHGPVEVANAYEIDNKQWKLVITFDDTELENKLNEL